MRNGKKEARMLKCIKTEQNERKNRTMLKEKRRKQEIAVGWCNISVHMPFLPL